MVANDRFGKFEIARGADGMPIELPRSSDEFVFLAFDVAIKRLVELHVIKGGEKLSLSAKRSVMDRASLSKAMARPSFVRLMEVGEDDEVPFYSSSLNDGEFLEDYILRRGALPPQTAFNLILQVLNDVLALKAEPRLLCGLSIRNPQVTLLEDTFLQLRVVDIGLSALEDNAPSLEDRFKRLVVEACEVIFLMLTGKPYGGDDCDRFPVLTGLPSGLRAVLRSSLMNADNAPSSVERIRDDVKETLSALTRDVGSRTARKHLVASDSLLPKSTLREVLLHDLPLAQLLKGRLVIEGDEEQRRYPFTLQALDAKTEAPVTVHLLPPKRIVQSEHYDAVPLQMWRFNADKHPNILRSLSVWESPDLTFLTEERTPGLPLSRLIAERVYLNPPEVLIIMRQVKRGIEQALECGVEKLDVHPSNIFLRLGGAPQAREMEKLLQKRLDAWPKFHVMLRPHMTMRSLYESMLVDRIVDETGRDEFFDAKDFRNRSYVSLAAYLLSGEKQKPGSLQLPDSVPTQLANYVGACLDGSRHPGRTPTLQDFLTQIETLTSVPEVEPEGGGFALPVSRGASRPVVETASAPVPMESVGAVSDFDEDEPASYTPQTPRPKGTSTSLLDVPSVRERKPAPKGRMGMIIWGGVFAILIILAMSMFSGHKEPEKKAADPGVGGPQGESVKRTSSSPSSGAKLDSGRPPMTPEEIRRALMPSDQERNAVKTKQSSRGENVPGDDVSVTAPSSHFGMETGGASKAFQRGSQPHHLRLFRKVTLWTYSHS